MKIIQRANEKHPMYDRSVGGYVVATVEPVGDITRLHYVLDANGFTLTSENVEEPDMSATCQHPLGKQPVFTRPLRRLFRKTYWLRCWDCDLREGPFGHDPRTPEEPT